MGAAEDDVEGHAFRRTALPDDLAADPQEQAAEEGDVEGHAFRRMADGDDDVQGHVSRGRGLVEDDDVEGHAARAKF